MMQITEQIPDKRNSRRWVWSSSPESFRERKVSVLAMVETLAAAVLYFYIAFSYGTLHLTVAASVAPLLLLRTPRSVQFALNWSSKRKNLTRIPAQFVSRKTQYTFTFELFFGFAAYLVFLILPKPQGINNAMRQITMAILVGLLVGSATYFRTLFIRCVSTARSLFLRTTETLSGIPRNWWQSIACLDSAHPPELLPGAIEYEEQRGYVSNLQPYSFTYMSIMRNDASTLNCSKTQKFWNSVAPPFLTASAFLCTVAALIYRLSLKGTAVLMLPMVWLIFDARRTTPAYYVKSKLAGALYNGSLFVIAAAVGILAIRFLGIDIGLADPLPKLLTTHDSKGLLAKIFPKDGIRLWTVILVCLCATTVISYLYADRLSVRKHSTKEVSIFRFWLALQGILSTALIFSLLFLSASLVDA